MNLDSKLLAAAGASIAAIDFSQGNARIAELERDIARTEAAIETANARRQEISETLRPPLSSRGYEGVDGPAVADALLANLNPSEAACVSKTRDDLEQEREALREGVIDLRKRIDAMNREVRDIRTGACKQARETVQPVVDAISADAQAAARHIMECFAALQAIGAATKTAGVQMVAIRNALDGVMGQYRLLGGQAIAEVPPSIIGLLSGLADKGEALPANLVTSVGTR